MRLVLAGLALLAICIPATASAKTLQEHAEDQAALIIAKDLCHLSYDQEAWGAFIVATVPRDQLQAFMQTMTGLVLKTGFDIEQSPAEVKKDYCTKAEAYVQVHALSN